MEKSIREQVSPFIEAVLTLRSKEECEMFFSDLCSEEELTRISRRVEIAKLICEGKTYREILEVTKASNITISRLKNVLEKEGSALAKIVKSI